MQQTQGDQDASGERQKALEVMYQQVAAQHDRIDDFRAKLLGLLPAVTGLGLLVTIGEKKPDSLNSDFLAAIGIFGALASIGLLVHELRSISRCYMLISIGFVLEHRLTKTGDDDARFGSFSSRLAWGFGGPVSRENAALIVYPASIAAWGFVAAWPTLDSWSLAVPVFLFFLAAIVGHRWLAWDRRRVAEHVPEARAVRSK
jgi:hypothetical protein